MTGVQTCALPISPLELTIDFLPDMEREAVSIWLMQRKEQHGDLACDSLLTGMVHRRIGEELVRRGIRNSVLATLAASRLHEEHLASLTDVIKGLSLPVASTRDWTQAQVTAGGLSVDEFSSDTMESKHCSGLFAAGELLDIDGPCGGFNLQWAWSSGWLAGFRAAGDLLRTQVDGNNE